MTTARKIYDDFDRAADSLGTNRALSWLKSTCDKLSSSAVSGGTYSTYHFSDGSALFVSYADAFVTFSA